MARYVFLYFALAAATDHEVWVGLDLPDDADVSTFDELIPVSDLTPADLQRKNVNVWHEVRGDVTERLLQLGLEPLPVV